MKIFIFDTSPGWSYCGGASVVIAENFDNAVKLLLDYKDEDGDKILDDNKFYARVEDIPDLEKHHYSHEPSKFFYEKTYGWDEWVLVNSYEVTETVPGVVLVSFNYA